MLNDLKGQCGTARAHRDLAHSTLETAWALRTDRRSDSPFPLKLFVAKVQPKAVLLSVVSGHDCDLNIFQPGNIHVSLLKSYGPKVPLKLLRKIKADQESETGSYI